MATYTWPQAIDTVVRLTVRGWERIDALARQVQALNREPGPQGERGPPGKLPITKAWADRVYDEGDTVTRDGNLYQALTRTGKEPGHADWQMLVPKGADAPEPEHCGLYDSSRSYRRLSIVALDGGAFLAVKDDPGPCPGDGWRNLVQRGKPGQRGEKGDRGERGLRGETVKQVGWREDVEGYRAFPVYSDGTEGPALPILRFFERYHSERA